MHGVRSRVRFSLTTLFMSLTAMALVAWFVARLLQVGVTSIGYDRGAIVVHFDGQGLGVPSDPYNFESYQNLQSRQSSSTVLLHDAYIALPISFVALLVASCFGLIVLIRVALARWMARRRGVSESRAIAERQADNDE